MKKIPKYIKVPSVKTDGTPYGEWLTRLYDEKMDGTKSNITIFEQEGFLHSFYIQNRWTPTEKWVIQPGIRVTYYSENERFYSAPRISIIKKVLPNLTLESSVGKHFQFIHQLEGDYTTRGSQGMWILSSDKIPIISSTNHHLGFNWDYGNYSLTTEFYYRFLNDLFQLRDSYIPASSLHQNRAADDDLMDGGKGFARGFELLIGIPGVAFVFWSTKLPFTYILMVPELFSRVIMTWYQ